MSMEIGNGVASQIMDLKTSTPNVTRKEEIKTGFKNINDYSKYLQGKYDYMNRGTVSIQGVPVTVNVSPAFLEKCNNNPDKAAHLEENLAAIPNCIKEAVNYTKRIPGNPVMTFETIEFDDNGNITMISGCTNDPDGKIAKENAKRKQEEERAAKEKQKKKQAEEKLEAKKAAERSTENATSSADVTLSAVGTNIVNLTTQLISNMSFGISNTGTVSAFDVKA